MKELLLTLVEESLDGFHAKAASVTARLIEAEVVHDLVLFEVRTSVHEAALHKIMQHLHETILYEETSAIINAAAQNAVIINTADDIISDVALAMTKEAAINALNFQMSQVGHLSCAIIMTHSFLLDS